jgi:hypothetical protein
MTFYTATNPKTGQVEEFMSANHCTAAGVPCFGTVLTRWDQAPGQQPNEVTDLTTLRTFYSRWDQAPGEKPLETLRPTNQRWNWGGD